MRNDSAEVLLLRCPGRLGGAVLLREEAQDHSPDVPTSDGQLTLHALAGGVLAGVAIEGHAQVAVLGHRLALGDQADERCRTQIGSPERQTDVPGKLPGDRDTPHGGDSAMSGGGRLGFGRRDRADQTGDGQDAANDQADDAWQSHKYSFGTRDGGIR